MYSLCDNQSLVAMMSEIIQFKLSSYKIKSLRNFLEITLEVRAGAQVYPKPVQLPNDIQLT